MNGIEKPTSARPRPGLAGLLALTALGAAACAIVGIWFRGEAGTRTVETLYGPVEVIVGGLYQGNSPALVAEGIGWDYVTLFLVVPAMLVLSVLLGKHGGMRVQVATGGLFFYCLYQYFQYAIGYAFGPLTPAFIAVAGGAMLGFVWSLGTILDARPGPGYPRRAMVAVLAFLLLVMVGMWGARIAGALPQANRQAALLGGTTMPAQVMDLVLLCPLCLFFTVLLLRRVRLGFVLAAVLTVKGSALGLAVGAMVLTASLTTGELQLVPIVLFFGMGAACATVSVLAIRSLN